MRTFILRARHTTTRFDKIRAQIGAKGHFEVIAHSIIQAFFISSAFRTDVVFYVILESSEDFPRTIRLSSAEGLSLSGFHEMAVVSLFEEILKKSNTLKKDEVRNIEKGVHIFGYGFDKLLQQFEKSNLFMLSPKGEKTTTMDWPEHPIFILSDHLMMPKKTTQSLKRQGVRAISLGKKMLFASQCIVLLNHALDEA